MDVDGVEAVVAGEELLPERGEGQRPPREKQKGHLGDPPEGRRPAAGERHHGRPPQKLLVRHVVHHRSRFQEPSQAHASRCRRRSRSWRRKRSGGGEEGEVGGAEGVEVGAGDDAGGDPEKDEEEAGEEVGEERGEERRRKLLVVVVLHWSPSGGCAREMGLLAGAGGWRGNERRVGIQCMGLNTASERSGHRRG